MAAFIILILFMSILFPAHDKDGVHNTMGDKGHCLTPVDIVNVFKVFLQAHLWHINLPITSLSAAKKHSFVFRNGKEMCEINMLYYIIILFVLRDQ